MTDIEKLIQEKEEELISLKKELRELKVLPVEKKLATKLHELLCRNNHIDGCGWYYSDDWNECAHKEYLRKAKAVLLIEPDEEKIIEIVNQLS